MIKSKKQKTFREFDIISLAIGVLIGAYTSYVTIGYLNTGRDFIENTAIAVISGIALLINAFGLFCGIKGLKSNRWNIAVIGIILCSLSFIPLFIININIHPTDLPFS